MNALLPPARELYEALHARSPVWEGRAYVCVKTTGIFCRLTCPARKPKFENCEFEPTVEACLAAGFRPCKRCRPTHDQIVADPIVDQLREALDAAPERRWSEADLRTRGLDPSSVRRAFRRHYGMTFLEFARARRMQMAAHGLARGDRVIEAQFDAGFESASGFRRAFANLLGASPRQFTADTGLYVDWVETPIGPMVAVADASALHILDFLDRPSLPAALQKRIAENGGISFAAPDPIQQVREELSDYFAGVRGVFTSPIHLVGTDFSQTVWRALRDIPTGEVRSYKAVAQIIGRPKAVRAVARANATNPLAIIVPCHRVIGHDGSLTGYGGGLWRKQKLITLERAIADKTILQNETRK
ncbi:MAG: trifunctional transcriptional activator/DNA repair protein Ada/methylated-DNA--[protein]-cysteine S-methyltransferase [Pseudomonadota bacterium]